jgi:hypothetical protein
MLKYRPSCCGAPRVLRCSPVPPQFEFGGPRGLDTRLPGSRMLPVQASGHLWLLLWGHATDATGSGGFSAAETDAGCGFGLHDLHGKSQHNERVCLFFVDPLALIGLSYATRNAVARYLLCMNMCVCQSVDLCCIQSRPFIAHGSVCTYIHFADGPQHEYYQPLKLL